MKILYLFSFITGISTAATLGDIQELKPKDGAKTLSYYREASNPIAKAASTGPRVIAPRANPSLGPTLPQPRALPAPSSSSKALPWKTQIPATVFWIGEEPTQNNPTPNHKSSWDQDWKLNYGGYDDPDPTERVNYRPKAFHPHQNPFYIALPYNDVASWNQTKPEAKRVIPWFNDRFNSPGKSVLKGQWIAIRVGNKTCYAQWEDCGPFHTDDWNYVFGNGRPKNTSKNGGAGIDVSPSVRDFLTLKSGQLCDWRFVDAADVPNGPWKTFGVRNHYINSRSKPSVTSDELEKLRLQRDDWVRRQSAIRGATAIRPR